MRKVRLARRSGKAQIMLSFGLRLDRGFIFGMPGLSVLDSHKYSKSKIESIKSGKSRMPVPGQKYLMS